MLTTDLAVLEHALPRDHEAAEAIAAAGAVIRGSIAEGVGAPVSAAGTETRATHPTLTERQRVCVLWSARGKSDWEISKILGIQPDTVVQHLKQARERYGVQKRTLLAVHALFDGTISFAEVFKR